MSMDNFRKSFTGFVLLDEDHYLLLDYINELQENEIQHETGEAQNLKNQAQTNTIINGILMGLGLILFIIRVTLAINILKTYIGRGRTTDDRFGK